MIHHWCTIKTNTSWMCASSEYKGTRGSRIMWPFTSQNLPSTHQFSLCLVWWLRWQRIYLQCRRPRFDPGKIPGEVFGNPLQYSSLENFMDRRAWWATVPWDLKESDTTEQLTVSPVYSLSWESNWFKLRVLFICPYQRRQCCWEFYLNSNQFAYKGLYRQSYGFSSSHVWMWDLDHKESWVPKNWCFWTMVLEKTLVSPLDCKEIKPVNPKGNQPWILFGRSDAEVEAPILWLPDVKSWLIGKDPDAGKDWRKTKRGGGNRGWDG